MNEIAVLLATYNGGAYIGEQIDSLLNQTEENWICYIHDDGSQDNTLQIVDEYRAKYPDKFIILDYQSQGGAKHNFISMLRYIDEPYAMFCDQDDVWLPHKISSELLRMKELEGDNEGKGVLVYSDSKVVDAECNLISSSFLHYARMLPSDDFNYFLINNCAQGATIMMNKTLYRRVLMCDTNNISMHDHWCALVAAAEGVISCIDSPLLLYRQHESNAVGADSKKEYLKKFYLLFNKYEREKFFINTFETFIIMAGEVLKVCDISGEKLKTAKALHNYDNLPFCQRAILLKSLGVNSLGIMLRAL